MTQSTWILKPTVRHPTACCASLQLQGLQSNTPSGENAKTPFHPACRHWPKINKPPSAWYLMLYTKGTGSHYLDYICSNYRRKKTQNNSFFNYSKGLLCGDMSASEVQWLFGFFPTTFLRENTVSCTLKWEERHEEPSATDQRAQQSTKLRPGLQ